MTRLSAVERARQELVDGRLWKARDRLAGAVATDPHDREVLDLLGEIHFAMGDLPAAGRAWLLAGRDDPDYVRAHAAFAERYPRPYAQLQQLKAYAPLDRYPALACQRVSALQLEASRQGDLWEPRMRTRASRADGERDEHEASWRDSIVGLAFIALIIGPWLLGVAAAVWLIARAVL